MTTIEYRYTLPGLEDELQIQAMAFAWGMDALPNMILKDEAPGEPLAEGYYITNMPWEREVIEEHARGFAEYLVNEPEANDEKPLTNAPELYIEQVVKGYTEGYLFGMFALSRGLLELHHSLPKDDRFGASFAFALELKLKEPAITEPQDEREERMVDGAEQLKAIYKQFRRLN
jgi:hypothetical protein